MSETAHLTSPRTHWLRSNALVGVGYLLLAMTVQVLAVEPGNVVPVWPPAGLAIWAVFHFGWRITPGLWVGEWLAYLWLEAPAADELLSVAGALMPSAVAVVLQALAGGGLLRYVYQRQNPLHRLTPALLMLPPLVALACLTSSSVSVFSLVQLGRVPVENGLQVWLLWWAGDTAGTLLVLPLLLALQLESSRNRIRWLLAVTLPVVLVLGGTVALYGAARDARLSELHAEAEHAASQALLNLRTRLDSHLSTLYAMQAYFHASERVTRTEFRAFVLPLIDRERGIQALEWIPRVPLAERAAFEAAARHDGLTDFEFTERDAEGKLVRAGEHPEYYPVFYVEPLAGNEPALGFAAPKLASRNRALALARRTGDLAISAPIRLVQEAGEQFGVLFFLPVFERTQVTEREPQLRGYVLMVSRMGDFVADALPPNSSLQLRFTDRPPDGTELLVASAGQDGSHTTLRSEILKIGGREWRIDINSAAPNLPLYWQSASLLLGGVGMAIALEWFLLLLTGRTRIIEDEVGRRGQELERTHSQLREAIEAMQDGFCLYDRHDRLVLCNDRYRELYSLSAAVIKPGASFEEILRYGLARGQYKQAIGREDEWLHERLEQHRNPDYRLELEQKLGDGRWLHIKERRNAAGDIVGIRSDITRIKLAEAALRESEQRWQFALDGARDGVWDWNPQTGEAFFSSRWTGMLGYANDDFAHNSESWGEIMHPDDRDRVFSELSKHLADPKVKYEVEFRLLCKDGSYKWVLARGKVIERDAKGQPLRMIGTHTDISERRATEEALAQERALFIAGPTVIVKWRATDTLPVEYVSPNAESVLGYSAAQLLAGEPRYLELIHPDDLQRILVQTSEHASTGQTHAEQQYRIRHGDGSWRWLYQSTTVVFDENGQVTHYHGYLFDDTERRAAAIALEESEVRYRNLVEHSPMAIHIHCDGRFVFLNREAVRLLGGDSAQVFLGQPVEMIWPKGSRINLKERLQKLLQRHSTLPPMELQFIRRDDSLVDVEVSGSLVEFDGKPAVQAVYHDISQRKQSIQALEESARRFRELADTAGVIPWEARTGTTDFTFVGPQSQNLLGYAAKDWLEPGFWEAHIHPDDRDWAPNYCTANSLDERKSYTFEFRMLAADGREVWLRNFVQTTTDSALVRGYMIDISESRRFQQELQEHRDNLQALVAERTQAMSEAMETAVAANRAKSEFLANMSHELRTPMHGILSFARLGTSKIGSAPSDKLAHYFQRIETSGARLMSLLNDLLDLSKLEAGRLELNLRRTTLRATIAAAAEEFHASLGEHGLRLTVACSEADPIELEFDAERILQVLRNLLSNAIKFSPDQGRITLNCTHDEQNNELVLTLVDEGPGIPDDELEDVFDKFIQSSRTRSGAGGTGLGLAISRQIVELHGGQLTAQNAANGGALLRMALPIPT